MHAFAPPRLSASAREPPRPLRRWEGELISRRGAEKDCRNKRKKTKKGEWVWDRVGAVSAVIPV